jgi:Spy/CpxP family protein refolding chaperone
MRLLFHTVMVAASLALAPAASAQTAPASAAAVAAPANPAAAVPVALGKRMACRVASQATQGQDRKDQMQLCMEQARLDCLKQAIEQKIVDPQRKDFVKGCME